MPKNLYFFFKRLTMTRQSEKYLQAYDTCQRKGIVTLTRKQAVTEVKEKLLGADKPNVPNYNFPFIFII